MRCFVFVCLVVLSTLLAQSYSTCSCGYCGSNGICHRDCMKACKGIKGGKRFWRQESQLETPVERYESVSIEEILRRLIE
ncbi:hypothetical protein HOLleu_38846 [Holothuria leucospilota]|uniref:Uncharacterized protein n=1 Tax=Holothuria leucospilota TaxID=206669 RepID=A0A9Q0YK20_HOLLE|nr:hypothetical protein HOLleu_38846 [Holothuria leucospilota]